MKKRLLTILLFVLPIAAAFADQFGPAYTGHRANDGYLYDATTIFKTNGSLTIGDVGAGSKFAIVRIPNVTIPNAYVVDSAYLGFRRYSAGYTTDSCGVAVYGEAADNPDTLGTAGAMTTRFASRTTAKVFVKPVVSNGGSDTTRRIYVTSILQEQINRAGFVSGNAVVYFIDDSTSTAVRDYYTWDGDSTTPKAPYLVAWYHNPTPGGGGGGTGPRVLIKK